MVFCSGYDSDSNSFVVNQLNSMDEIKIDSNVVTQRFSRDNTCKYSSWESQIY